MRSSCSDCGRPIVARRSKGRKGVIRPLDDHDLCQRCWKSHTDSAKAKSWRTTTVAKSLAEITDEVHAALSPLPDGYVVEANDEAEGVLVGNRDANLAFFISPLVIRDEMHISIAKEMFLQLILASPVKGSA
jgi:hypothetical protein